MKETFFACSLLLCSITGCDDSWPTLATEDKAPPVSVTDGASQSDIDAYNQLIEQEIAQMELEQLEWEEELPQSETEVTEPEEASSEAENGSLVAHEEAAQAVAEVPESDAPVDLDQP